MERFRAFFTKYRVLIIKLAVLAVVATMAGLIAECLLNYKVLSLPKEKQGVHEIALDTLEFIGFDQIDGKWVLGEGGGSVSCRVAPGYVHKLAYSYEYYGRMATTVTAYNGVAPNEAIVFQETDQNNVVLQGSVINIGEEVSRIEVSFPADASGLAFTGFQIQNKAYFNEMCFAFAAGLVLSIGCLVLLRKICYRSPEWIFLALVSFEGILLLLCMPSQHVSWDEGIHFGKSYEMSWIGNIGKPDIIEAYEINALENLPEDHPYSYEEQMMQDDYLDENGTYDIELLAEEDIMPANILKWPSTLGYVGSALGIFIGRQLHLQLSDLYVMGRAFNLLAYALLMFFAIRHLPFGKHILTVIALMPTPIFMASAYSYDPAVIGLVSLGFSYLISEFAKPNEAIRWKDYLIYAIAFFVAGCVKAVYFPLMLLGLFLPKEKFASKKERLLMKSGILGVCLLLMSIFILPSLILPNQAGDPRGGDTSISGQLQYILGNPIGYLLILKDSIIDTFFEYMMGSEGLSALGYFGIFPASVFIGVLLAFVIMTDTDYEVAELKIWHRGILLLTIAGTICLIWSALYLAFTPVGQQSIAGVQGRYYIPIMTPFFLAFNSKRIVSKISPGIYTSIIYGCSILLFFGAVFEKIVKVCCL